MRAKAPAIGPPPPEPAAPHATFALATAEPRGSITRPASVPPLFIGITTPSRAPPSGTSTPAIVAGLYPARVARTVHFPGGTSETSKLPSSDWNALSPPPPPILH